LETRKCRKIRGSLLSETRKCRKKRGSLSSETRTCRKTRGSRSFLLLRLQFAYFQEIQALEKWLLQLKLLCGIAFFWPWAARGLSGSFEHVIDCCQDYNSHISRKFEPWKKWLLQLKLLCGIAIFWPWAARGLSGSFENVIEFQKSAPLSWSGSFLLITSFKKCTTLVVRLVSVD